MKRILIIAVIVVAVLSMAVVTAFAATLIFASKKNEDNLASLMAAFSQLVEDASDDGIVESVSTYGKLCGNGNGIEYFGAVLVHKDSIDDIESLISELDEQFESVEYWEQEGNNIVSKYLNQALKYDTDINAEDEYVSICFFNSTHPESNYFDVKGH